MKNIPLFVGVLVGTLLLVIGVAVVFTRQANAPVDMTRLVGSKQNATGSAEPRVTIVEFSDLQCPACRAAQPAVKNVMDQHSDSVQLVFRHFPLTTIHPNALAAAHAAEVAASLGKFWQMHDLLFNNQEEWSELSPDEAIAKFGDYAEELEIPRELMEQGVRDQTFSGIVSTDIADGNSLGVNATPTFYVNGERVLTQNLQSVVENLLDQ